MTASVTATSIEHPVACFQIILVRRRDARMGIHDSYIGSRFLGDLLKAKRILGSV